MTDRELDALVAENVMGWTHRPIEGSASPSWFVPGDAQPRNLPRFSTYIADAWQVVEKLAPLAGSYHAGDGFFILKYGEFADHGEHEGYCQMSEGQEDEDCDLTPWSGHFHLGAMSDAAYPAEWQHFQKFCARGNTAARCICLAALKAVGVSVE